MEYTGKQILLESLKREGVETIFGYPGGSVIDLYDEISRHPDLKHILVRHEQGAVHAADGYARASGQVGVCLVTSGPGATNTVTGIATAYCDSIPLVILTGQVHTHLIGNDAFQEVDIVGITRPCTKHNVLVKDIKRLAQTIREAFHLARSGRPGPVLVDLPKDVLNQSCEFIWPDAINMRSYNPNYRPNAYQLKKCVDAIEQSRKPIFLVGGGVILSNASDILDELARFLNIPVSSTLMGLGAFPANDALSLGMVGMHGTYSANTAINDADLLICVGGRFDDRVTGKLEKFAPNAKIIHIDIDPTSIRKNVKVDIPIVADCKLALNGIFDICKQRFDSQTCAERYAEWLEIIANWKREHPLHWIKSDDPNASIKPQEAVEVLSELTAGDAIITTEVGQNQMWAAQFYEFTGPRTLLTSGGLGTMGYGFPAAIGAQCAFPYKKVIDIAGDASIQMNIQELATAVQYRLPVKILILNNRYLGMVRQWQELFFQRNYSQTCMDAQPDFVKLAEAYGASGYRISKRADLRSTLQQALEDPKPAIIDVEVEREENVYPMVPAGAALNEMLLI